MRRDLTHAEMMESWRVDGERNGHTPSQTIGFGNALAGVEESQRALPARFLCGAAEPWWLTRLPARFGR